MMLKVLSSFRWHTRTWPLYAFEPTMALFGVEALADNPSPGMLLGGTNPKHQPNQPACCKTKAFAAKAKSKLGRAIGHTTRSVWHAS